MNQEQDILLGTKLLNRNIIPVKDQDAIITKLEDLLSKTNVQAGSRMLYFILNSNHGSLGILQR